MSEIREIIGNTTATPTPQSDWNQTDPTKADYIKNKPETLSALPEVSGEDDGKIIDIVDGAYVLRDIASSAIGVYIQTVVEGSLDEIDKILGDGVALIPKYIDKNDTYDPTDDGADGYSKVIVDVPNGDIPAYDGAVVIGNDGSVLGLRRIRDSWFTNYITNVGELDRITNGEQLISIYSLYGFEIEPFEATFKGVTGTLLGLTTTFAYYESENTPNSIEWIVRVVINGQEMIATTDASTFTDIVSQFNITSTSNSTVDEWLLANTEGVSV